MHRRRFLSWLAGGRGVAAGLSPTGADAALLPTTTSAQGPRLVTAQTWPNLVLVKQLRVGHSVAFTFGAGSKWQGRSGAVYRASASTFKVFDLVCTHMGCSAVPMGATAVCPCHHSEFSLKTGHALSGPAAAFSTGPLTASRVVVRRGVVRWVADL